MSTPRDSRAGEGHAGSTAHLQALLGAVDDLVRDAHFQRRFGDFHQAFAAALESWIEPFAAAIRGPDPTSRSQSAARAIADLARLTSTFAGDAARSIARLQTGARGSRPGPCYADLAGRVDDSFRKFSSSPEFDRALRRAAAAVLDWIEHDPETAAGIARTLEPPTGFASDRRDDSVPADTKTVLRDGNATLGAYPGAGETRACVLVVPGFTIGARAFDLDPQRSIARTLAQHGVEPWLLDWGRTDETDRDRTVANQLDRIDRSIDAARDAANGRRPALAGHFHGGLLALLYCIRHPGKAGALVTLSTPVEFASNGDVLAGWLRACDGERLVDVFGNVPGPLVAALVAAASPMRWCGGGFLDLLGGLDSAGAIHRITRFEQARRFPPAFPGETFRGLYRAFYRDNAFAADGGALIDGERYELSGLETPLLNVFAREDRIVPPGASMPLGEWTGIASGSNRGHHGGHFELLTGREVHDTLLPEMAAWLIEHTQGT